VHPGDVLLEALDDLPHILGTRRDVDGYIQPRHVSLLRL
jgi:hypothetical protein